MAVDNIARALAAKALGGSSGPVTPEDVVTGIIVDGKELIADSDGKVALPIVTDTSESMATGNSALGLCRIDPNGTLFSYDGYIEVKEANPYVIA